MTQVVRTTAAPTRTPQPSGDDGLVHVPPVAVTPAPPGLETDHEHPPAVYRERPRFGRDEDGDSYGGPALDW
ncbi:hypothetical protein [Kitasatospora griseola]|uniref:hypothetical protein n=1 Tax=Kitasatospora griseola TaxID=2064 RepID=UPI0036501725